jgi:hypothetical protein
VIIRNCYSRKEKLVKNCFQKDVTIQFMVNFDIHVQNHFVAD